MTIIGHSLVGVSLGIVALPKEKSFITKLGVLFLFFLLANLPDLPFPGWGHDRYYFSHSLFIVTGIALLVIFAYLALYRLLIKKKPDLRFLCLMILALYSHLLLDSFYNHGLGVAIFWPVSSASLALPIPWLSVLKDLPPPITMEMIKIALLEFITFVPLVILALWYKTRFN